MAKLILLVALICGLGLILQRDWINRNKEKFANPFMSRLFQQGYKTEYLTVQCWHCEGTGLVDTPADDTKRMCPVCYGVGMNYIRRLEKTDILCAECLASGRVLDADGHPATCPRCDGSGVLRGHDTRGTGGQSIRILKIECDECVGSGTVRNPDTGRLEPCPVCFGRGYNWARKFNDSEALCPACGGLGRIRDPETGNARTCERCDGRGLIAPMQP